MTEVASDGKAGPQAAAGLKNVEVFKDLPSDIRAALAADMDQVDLARGETLMREGEPADTMYIVVSGRFEVAVSGRNTAVAEIGAGQPIGEIAFIAGGARTASVKALRDSIVLKLERQQFDRLSHKNPALWQTLSVTLARRLALMNKGRIRPPDPKPRTIVIIAAGSSSLPTKFVTKLHDVFQTEARTVCVTGDTFAEQYADQPQVQSSEATHALNALEANNDYILYVADPKLTPWTRKAIRQADLVLSVCRQTPDGRSNAEPNAVEKYAAEMHAPDAQRLVLLHDKRRLITGTARWLKSRTIAMHHHVALDDPLSFARLFRFIAGEARGLIACGGGAFCSAHVGVYKALLEAGIEFDIMGGTSGGAAMTAGFAVGTCPDDMDRQTHDMFVVNKALRRLTLPIYSLIDHTHFDRQLRRCCGEQNIEDLWIPFFAVSTNLSRYDLQRHRYGKLWQAVRASGSIPAVLPPFYTETGEMLVDGALVDNVPVRVMRELKSGPNIVLNFDVPKMERFAVQYDDMPSRGQLLSRLINPLRRKRLPDAPSLGAVLSRSMMANRHDFEQHLTDDDLLLVPPLPGDMTIMDWHRHSDLMRDAYRWGVTEIARLKGLGDPVLASMLAGAAASSSPY